ncbi:MAG: DUF4290 domain-containing protein [Bacteroidales bacterium]|nr:DUF4290 domain-containing protein [Bacteroidales bacterium]
MEYNTARNRLVIPEYGRNVQRMVEHTISVEDREKRNELANYIVKVMTQMHLSTGSFGDYEHKIWDHLFIISDFALDVDSPYPIPDKDKSAVKKPDVVYSDRKIRYKTYGRNLEKIIEKAIELEDGEEKDALVILIAQNLKKAYLNWNRSSVDDEQILEDLNRMSEGKLVLPEGYVLPTTNELIGKNRSYSKDSSKGSQSKGRDQKSNYRRNGRSDNQSRSDNKPSRYSNSGTYKKRSY